MPLIVCESHPDASAISAMLRDQWLGWPARVSALMAAELGVDSHKLEAMLTEQVREQLQASTADQLHLHES